MRFVNTLQEKVPTSLFPDHSSYMITSKGLVKIAASLLSHSVVDFLHFLKI
jgi:hypothetical protein